MFWRKPSVININLHFNIKESIMSKFLEDFRTLLADVAVGNPADAETKAKVDELAAKLTANEATDEEQSTAILELTQKLANSTPVVPETPTDTVVS